MYLGFLTACLPQIPLEEKLEWASENGFKALEVAVWPRSSGRDYAASDIDVNNFTQEDADAVLKAFEEKDMVISSLGYYDNNLDRDPEKRNLVNEHSKRVIEAAEKLGVELVGLFIGRNIDKSIQDNFDEFEEVFTDIVGYAEARGVKIMIENCPMVGWQQPNRPGTISFTPELWTEMFRRVPSPNFGLNFDPSHLLFQFIDYIEPIKEFRDRIFHVHAKDAFVDDEKFKRYGVFNNFFESEGDRQFQTGYWGFRMPGLGQVDFKAMIDTLKEIGYEGVISIEHEDPDYEGRPEKIYEGLNIGRQFLEDLI